MLYLKLLLYYTQANSVLITAGVIIMNDYVSTDTHLDVQFEGFTSKLDILMYYIALSNNTKAHGTDCKQYVSILSIKNDL